MLIEDDPIISSTLAETLTAHHYTVNQAVDGQTGLELAEAFEYDLILLDVVIPKLDGIHVCKQLRSQGYQAPILLLTAKDSATDRVMGLDAGADDYVVKPFNLDELMARIRALLRRGKPIPSSVITWENLYFDPVNSEIICNDRPLRLTPKEYCLLELFLLNPKRIFSRKAILDRLWDFSEAPGEETVSTHIKCLRQKLKAAGAADPVETVHGLGYRLRPPSETQSSESKLPAIPTPKGVEEQKIKAKTSKIWQKFKGKFIEQFSTLERVALALKTNSFSLELQQQAQQEAHKLAGSLGIFGLMQGSQLARELEDLFQTSVTLATADIEKIIVLVELLGQELQKTPDTEGESAASNYAPLVLIVDDDLLLADRIRIEAIAWGLRVEVATDLVVARKAIAQSPPNVVLLDLNFPGAETGLVLLKELMQRQPQIPVLAFTGQGNLTDRLEVARLGGCVFLQKPLPTYEILKAVTDVLHQSQIQHHNQILIMDNDGTVFARMSELLQPLGVEVTGLRDSKQFWTVLTNTAPNLLVIDLELSGFSGLELCQTVRSDPKWRHLPIVFLSAHTAVEKIEQAFVVGADDYMSKAIADAELVTRIIHRLKRGGFQTTETREV
nr:response regulator [Trichocoleus sp. FACHB-46]